MKTIQHLLLFLLIGAFFSQPIIASDVTFIQNNLEEAKRQAAQEGKLILVDFWASWCDPCIWMDEHTFTSTELSSYLAENYISVRIDIDNIEGYNYKEEYNIRFLPSILILNEQGQLIKKYEESFAPSKLIKALKLHNKGRTNGQYYNDVATETYRPTNPVTTNPEVQTPPTWQPALSSDYATNTSAADQALSEYTTPTDNYATSGATSTNTYSNSSTTYSDTEYATSTNNTAAQSTTTYSDNTYTAPVDNYATSNNNTAQSSTTTYSDNTYTAPADNYATSTSNSSQYTATSATTNADSPEGLYRFNVYPAPNDGYSLQVGAYYEYGNVLREVSAFQEQYPDAIFVHISTLNGDPCYKILLGHYTTYEMAGQQKALLKTKGLDCFVKELKMMGQKMQ